MALIGKKRTFSGVICLADNRRLAGTVSLNRRQATTVAASAGLDNGLFVAKRKPSAAGHRAPTAIDRHGSNNEPSRAAPPRALGGPWAGRLGHASTSATFHDDDGVGFVAKNFWRRAPGALWDFSFPRTL